MSKKNNNQSPEESHNVIHDVESDKPSFSDKDSQDEGSSFSPNKEADNDENQKMNDIQKALKEAQEKATYLAADYENFRRRSQQDSERRIVRERSRILSDLLTIVDDFERSFSEVEEHVPELASRFAGFELIYKALKKVLTEHGVEEITSIEVFDPEIHEAVMQVDDPDVKSGNIVAVLQKGYLLNGDLLRPVKVSVKP